jgi:ubiquinone/menaquinone biosynthesis C-methylase UbiE
MIAKLVSNNMELICKYVQTNLSSQEDGSARQAGRHEEPAGGNVAMSSLATVAPWNLVAAGYSEVSVEFFEGFNEAALEMVAPGETDRLLDVGCGPGTLSLIAASRVAAVDAVDFSENMIAILRRHAADRGLKNICPLLGDGQGLPFEGATFDAAFSMFGLMFFPDRAKGYGEIFRTLKNGGRACVSSWAPVDRSPMMQVMFGALRAINPNIPEAKTDIASLENPDVLASELGDAGFKEVEVCRVTKGIEFASASEYWDKMTRGSAPVLMMKRDMGEDMWRAKSEIAVDHVARTVGAFPAVLTADAWLGVATK